MNKQIKNLFLDLIISLFNAIVVIKRLLVRLFTFIFKIVFRILKLLFFRKIIIIKLYQFYLFLKNKKEKYGLKITSLLISKYFVHLFILFLIIIILGNNVNAKQKSYVEDVSPNVILSKLVMTELDNLDQGNGLIVEKAETNYNQQISQKNLEEQKTAIKSELKIEPQSDETNIIPFTDDKGAIVKPKITKINKSKKQRNKAIIYIVKPGDTVSTIAEHFSVSVNTILWENNLSAYSIIRPGDKLTILPKSGINHIVRKGETLLSIAKKYKVDQNEILKNNSFLKNNYLKVGEKLFIPNGKKIRVSVVRNYHKHSNKVLSNLKKLFIPPKKKFISSGYMAWPTVGHRITQYYHWGHHAIDIANRIGTPIYASDSGVIEHASWGRGYGNYIKINHGGGKETLYAHLSKFYVKKGDRVKKGQVIGAMGSTGWSTGPHVHFEIRINGRKVNPLNYVK